MPLHVVAPNQVVSMLRDAIPRNELDASSESEFNAVLLKGTLDSVAQAPDLIEVLDQPLLGGHTGPAKLITVARSRARPIPLVGPDQVKKQRDGSKFTLIETATEGTGMALTDPGTIANAAETIYQERYREGYEQSNNGEFLVIDVTSGEAYLGKYAEDALQNARRKAPHGIFHLLRIGAPGAFKVSYIDRGQPGRQPTDWDWPLRPTG